MHVRHVPDNRHKVLKAFGTAANDAVAILLVVVCDALHDTSELVHTLPPPFAA